MTLSVAALASCSNDETLDTNRSAISFRSLVEGMTRGTSVTVANLDQFKVTAVGNGKVYMDKVAVNGSESGAKWATEGTYYWPASQLDFYGYAPADAQGVTLNETTRTIADFTPAQKVEEQKDLVIACNTGTKESNQETGVPMNFRHALSQVVVKTKCPAENMKVEVIGIKVANVAGKGTFTFPADVTTGKDTRQLDFSLWSGLGDATAAYMKRGDAPVTLTRDAQDITFADRFILVPQQLTAWAGNNEDKETYLSVLCRISNVSGDNVTQLYPSEEGKYGFSTAGTCRLERNLFAGRRKELDRRASPLDKRLCRVGGRQHEAPVLLAVCPGIDARGPQRGGGEADEHTAQGNGGPSVKPLEPDGCRRGGEHGELLRHQRTGALQLPPCLRQRHPQRSRQPGSLQFHQHQPLRAQAVRQLHQLSHHQALHRRGLCLPVDFGGNPVAGRTGAGDGRPLPRRAGAGHHLVCRPQGDHQGGECGHCAEGRTRAGHLVVAHLGDFCRRGADHPREDVPCKGSIRVCLRVHAGQPRLVRDGRSGVPRASMCRPSRHSPAVRS